MKMMIKPKPLRDKQVRLQLLGEVHRKVRLRLLKEVNIKELLLH